MTAAHILVLGAAGNISRFWSPRQSAFRTHELLGPSGLEFCAAALAHGHQLTLYVWNPSKIPASISSNDKVNIIEGSLEDAASLERAVGANSTIVISFAGPVAQSKGAPITEAMKTIFPLLTAHKYERAMILCTPSFVAPQDQGAMKWRISVILIKIIAGLAYDDLSGLGDFVTSQDVRTNPSYIFIYIVICM